MSTKTRDFQSEIYLLQAQVSTLTRERDEQSERIRGYIAMLKEGEARITELEAERDYKDLKIASMNARIEGLEASLSAARGRERTAGTIEICRACAAPVDLMKLGCQHDCAGGAIDKRHPVDACPLRTQGQGSEG